MPAPSQHQSYPLTSWFITLWFIGAPLSNTAIPHSHPHLHPSSLSDPAPSFPSSSLSPSSPSLLGLPPSLDSTHLCSISSAVPPSLQIYFASCPLFFLPLSLPALQSYRQLGDRRSALSPWVGDPCRGDKLPTAACLHNWKIKDLWGREGSVCVRWRVREMLVDQAVCEKERGTVRLLYVCEIIKTTLIACVLCACVCKITLNSLV